jgi:phosphatidylinositol glycan class U
MGTLFRPPSTLYSLNVGLALMLYEPRTLARLQRNVTVICMCALPIPVILYVVAYWMWIEIASGEANFVYFQCLAYNVFVSLLLLQFGCASLQRDKVLRVTEKLIGAPLEKS